jgi:hypothetical protein
MSKRSTGKPHLRSEGELKQNINRRYGAIQNDPTKINPVFLEDHYGIKKSVKEVADGC